MIKVIYFYAPWCGPCTKMSPEFDSVKNKLENEVEFNFSKISIDDEPELRQDFGVEVVPTIFILKNEEQVEKIVGFCSKDELEEKIKSYA